MSKFLLITLILLGNISHAQQNFFNKRYNLDYIEHGLNILQDSNNFIVVGPSHSMGSRNKIRLSKIDSAGSLVWTKTIESANKNYYSGGQGSFVKTSDNGYVLGGSVVDSTGEEYGMLLKFNSNGDTMWSKVFGDTSYEAFYQCKQTFD
ncbi:MAG: hypothetical protein ABI763_13290 [Bacteroidota bacterium]